jgi:hypothetical protein
MNSFKKLLLTKTIIAAAVATCGIVAPVVSHANPGTPDDGMACRAGYIGVYDGKSLKCFKTSRITVPLVCADPGFNKYVARVVAGGTQLGEDVCIKTGGLVKFDSDDSIGSGTNFTKNVDWEFAKADKVKIGQKTVARDLEEAAAFGGTASDVETVAADPVLNRQADGIIDNATVTLTHFTFAVPAAGGAAFGNSASPVGQPATANSTSAFVPRPLPR